MGILQEDMQEYHEQMPKGILARADELGLETPEVQAESYKGEDKLDGQNVFHGSFSRMTR